MERTYEKFEPNAAHVFRYLAGSVRSKPLGAYRQFRACGTWGDNQITVHTPVKQVKKGAYMQASLPDRTTYKFVKGITGKEANLMPRGGQVMRVIGTTDDGSELAASNATQQPTGMGQGLGNENEVRGAKPVAAPPAWNATVVGQPNLYDQKPADRHVPLPTRAPQPQPPDAVLQEVGGGAPISLSNSINHDDLSHTQMRAIPTLAAPPSQPAPTPAPISFNAIDPIPISDAQQAVTQAAGGPIRPERQQSAPNTEYDMSKEHRRSKIERKRRTGTEYLDDPQFDEHDVVRSNPPGMQHATESRVHYPLEEHVRVLKRQADSHLTPAAKRHAAGAVREIVGSHNLQAHMFTVFKKLKPKQRVDAVIPLLDAIKVHVDNAHPNNKRLHTKLKNDFKETFAELTKRHPEIATYLNAAHQEIAQHATRRSSRRAKASSSKA